ncbi:MAG: hypothetical protein HW418_3181 [Anaerolineales bacterium]|nr:hypothetical protein [Anaerolineales bacterium]
MPNASVRLATPHYRDLHGTPPTDHLTWRVPIDDEHHISFLVCLVHATGEEAERHRDTRREEASEGITAGYGLDVAAKVIAGQIDWEDLLTISDSVRFSHQ